MLLSLIKLHAIKMHGENGGVALLILNLGSRWRLVVSTMLQPPFATGKGAHIPCIGNCRLLQPVRIPYRREKYVEFL
jgi:hypothetical protein